MVYGCHRDCRAARRARDCIPLRHRQQPGVDSVVVDPARVSTGRRALIFGLVLNVCLFAKEGWKNAANAALEQPLGGFFAAIGALFSAAS